MGTRTEAAVERLRRGVQTAFEQIHRDKMQDVPLLNPALQVATVGFRYWDGRAVGIVLTPWMMKLVAVPLLPQSEPLQPGKLMFPFGPCAFEVDELPGCGPASSCSLFSPMQEFSDQAAAVATAEEIMAGLFRPAQSPVMDRRRFLRGDYRAQGG